MRRQAPYAVPNDAPISEVNTTPLIEVRLVLLIMFIITIPITTHKVPVDLPSGGVAERDPVVHRLAIDAGGRVSLDGAPIGDAELKARLTGIAADPASELHLWTDGAARYERFDEVLADVKRAGINRMGMIGNERFAEEMR